MSEETIDGDPNVTFSGDGTVAVGRVLGGKYRLQRRLGEGGMGVVYEAEHLLLGTSVAVKVLQPTRYGDRNAAERMMREARAAASTGHPNIAAVTDMGWEGDQLFFVMELVLGATVEDSLSRGKMVVDRALAILEQVLRGLQAVHDQGIVHRDLKPHNIMVSGDEDGHPIVKILDFGIAKHVSGSEDSQLTQDGAIMGTPCYMAPEQAHSGDVDARSDLYSAGVLLYTMLAGRPPFAGNTALATLTNVIQGEYESLQIIRPELPMSVHGLVERAMALKPDDRFQDAASMRAAVRGLAGGRNPVKLAGASTASEPALRPEDFSHISVEDDSHGSQASMPAGLSPDLAWPTGGPDPPTIPQPTAASSVPGDAKLELDMSRALGQQDEAPGRRRPFLGSGLGAALVVGAILVGLGGGYLYFADPRAGGAGRATVKIELRGLPERSTVFVDGEPHPERPLKVPRSDDHVRIQVEAPGFRPRTIQVLPARDRGLELKLDPE